MSIKKVTTSEGYKVSWNENTRDVYISHGGNVFTGTDWVYCGESRTLEEAISLGGAKKATLR